MNAEDKLAILFNFLISTLELINVSEISKNLKIYTNRTEHFLKVFVKLKRNMNNNQKK